MRILLWRQADRDDVMVIRSGVVDAARQYGPYSRHGTYRGAISIEAYFSEDATVGGPRHSQTRVRAKIVPPELWAHDDTRQALDISAVNREIKTLSPRWRKALSNSVNRVHQTNGMEVAATKAKRRLRKLCA